MSWKNPLPGFRLVPTVDKDSYLTMPWWPVLHTGVPMPGHGHPGSFGHVRKHNIHEGVDIYVPNGEPIHPVEDGIVVAVGQFTGAAVGSPWWNDTDFVMVEGPSGVVLYGELEQNVWREVGDVVSTWHQLGSAAAVMKKENGRPRTMLHLELYKHGTREPVEWKLGQPQPAELLDPTINLLTLCQIDP